MPQKHHPISQFWEELKRRRVVHVITVYASAAFVLIELANNLTEPLSLPSKLSTIIIVILAVGFPLVIILAWLYDLTPEGIEKTKAVDKTGGSEKTRMPNAWRVATYLSFVVIVGLLTLNIVGGPKQLRAGDIQSLAILPFENYTGDDTLENMVAGMHSLLCGDMSRISGLRVTGKTSSNLYKDVKLSAVEIAGELKVDALVEATVMCLGDTVCMQFRLVSTKGEEEQLWVGEYREEKSQILNLYNRVTKQIAEEVMIELTESEEKTLAKNREADRDAIDAYIRSLNYWGDLSAEAFDKAEEFLNLALKKDPEWSTLYAAMAVVWGGRMQMGMVDTETGRRLIHENIDRARKLDADFVDSHFINAVLFTWSDWEWENGEKEFLKALAINPNHVMARMYYAHLLMSLQRMDEALIQARLAVELDPKNPLVLALYSVVLKGARKDQEVLKCLEEALAIDPEHAFTKSQIGRAHYNLGEYEKHLKIQEASLMIRLGGEKVPDLVNIFREKGQQASYQELAKQWEMIYEGQDLHPVFMSRLYYWAGEFEKALDELQKAYLAHNPNMPYIGTGTRYEALHDSSRFLAILDNMNLPLPRNP